MNNTNFFSINSDKHCPACGQEYPKITSTNDKQENKVDIDTWDNVKEEFDKAFFDDYPTFVKRNFDWFKENYNPPTKR